VKKLCWIDIETTDLDPRKGSIIEVGMIVTDWDLEVLVEYDVLVYPFRDHWDPWCVAQHTKTGLKQRSEVRGQNIDVAEGLLVDAHKRMMGGESAPMCGASVHFDRAWLKEHMPSFERLFHYRNIDVSSIDAFFRSICQMPVERSSEEVAHTALADLHATIDHLRRCREQVRCA